MLIVLIHWVTIIFISLSFGNVLVSLWNKILKKEEGYSFFDTFYLGLAFISALAVLLSLFFPLNIYILLCFIVFSAVYWIFNRKLIVKLYNMMRQTVSSLSLLTKITLLLVIAIVAVRAVQAPLIYDLGLYHQQSMMWTEQYSVVPGLGNLHGRLAFNSSHLILNTLFSYHPDYYAPLTTLNCLGSLIFFIWLVMKADRAKSVFLIIGVFCSFAFIFFPLSPYLSSTSTDILPGILICYIFFSCILEKDSFTKRQLALCIIPFFIITLKLSLAFIFLIPLLVFFLQLKKRDYRRTVFIFVCGLIVSLPWLSRFVILSGYLIYPFPDIDIFSFDWKIPVEMVEDERNWIYSWAKIPHLNPEMALAMPFDEWFPIWFSKQSDEYLQIYYLALASPLLMLFCIKKIKQKPMHLYVWLVAFVSSIYTFYTAPDLRFMFGTIISAAIIPLLLIDFTFLNKLIFKVMAYVIFGYFFFDYFLIELRAVKAYQDKDTPLYTLIYKPQPFDYGKKIQQSGYTIEEIDGTKIYVPDKDQAFDLPLPSAVSVDEDLQMRGKSLQNGFRINR